MYHFNDHFSVPSKRAKQENIMEEYKLERRQICRACLVMDVKMYNIHKLNILTTYTDLTGISDLDTFPYICYECAARLSKCEEFRSNCLKAFETLTNMETTDDIQKDRKLKCLESPLKPTVFNVFEFVDIEQSNKIVIKTESFNEQTKNEISIVHEYVKNKAVDDDAEDNENSCKFVDENLFPYDDSSNIEEKPDLQDVIIKNKKRKVVKTRNKELYSLTDDEPLSKLHKTIKKRFGEMGERFKWAAEYFEEYATVTTMTPEDAKIEIELRKESNNYKNSQYKCNLCYRGYGLKGTYDNHMKKHDLTSGKYECEICNIRFTRNCIFRKHFADCHILKFSCKKCTYVCFSASQARVHMKSHKGVKYTCDECDKSFSMPNSLHSHKRLKHSTNYVCAFCGDSFVKDKGLKSHIVLMHKQETNEKNGPSCAECDVQFATETAWKRHLVLSEKHRVSNGCKICGDIFTYREDLKFHMKSHDVAKKQQFETTCSICKVLLSSRTAYVKHMTSEHPDSDVTTKLQNKKACVCEVCGKSYSARALLVYHQRTHTGERPYKCKDCEKTFFNPMSYYLHRRIHVTDRAFKCDMCIRVFKSKDAVIKHIRKSHLNIRPHICDICGKSFQHPCEVKYHKQHVHGNVPWPKRDRSKRNKTKELK